MVSSCHDRFQQQVMCKNPCDVGHRYERTSGEELGKVRTKESAKGRKKGNKGSKGSSKGNKGGKGSGKGSKGGKTTQISKVPKAKFGSINAADEFAC